MLSNVHNSISDRCKLLPTTLQLSNTTFLGKVHFFFPAWIYHLFLSPLFSPFYVRWFVPVLKFKLQKFLIPIRLTTFFFSSIKFSFETDLCLTHAVKSGATDSLDSGSKYVNMTQLMGYLSLC